MQRKHKYTIIEKLIATFEDYSIFKADAKCINELSQFIVVENYKHHIGSVKPSLLADDIADVTKEEQALYGDNTYIYIARDNQGKMLGSIRSFLSLEPPISFTIGENLWHQSVGSHTF